MDASSGRRHQLDALADPTRRAILELLRERPLTAGEIAARFSQQRPAISKHLTLLRTTGWLAESRDRQRRIYSLRNDAVVVVVDWARRLGEGLGPSAGESPVHFPRSDANQSRPPRADGGAGGVPREGRPEQSNGATGGGFDRVGTARSTSKLSAISDLKSQIARTEEGEARASEVGAVTPPARSSFELIFD